MWLPVPDYDLEKLATMSYSGTLDISYSAPMIMDSNIDIHCQFTNRIDTISISLHL